MARASFGIRAVARLYRDDVPADRAAEESRSPMISRILCRTNSSGKRSGSLLSTLSPRTTMAFSSAAAPDQPFVHQRLHVFVKNERAGRSDFRLVNSGRDFRAENIA